MFGRLPSYGLYCRHVKDLRLRGIEFGAVTGEARPAMVCDDVKSLDVDGFRSAGVASGQPVVRLTQTRRALLRGCVAPAGTKTFLEVQGDQSERIVVAASELSAAAKAVETGGGVPSGAILTS